MTKIGVLGEYNPGAPTHLATDAALGHASALLGIALTSEWLATDQISEQRLLVYDALLVAPGSPYRDLEKTLLAIRFARERGVPCLGTCGGFQHMVLEYARNVLGFVAAQHAEYDPLASELFVSKLACSLRGRTMTLQLAAGSQVAACYEATEVEEQYYCNFGVDPERVQLLKSGPLRISGSDAEGELRVLELPGHPFFIGTLFVPQARSTAARPHPLLTAFVRAAALYAATQRRLPV